MEIKFETFRKVRRDGYGSEFQEVIVAISTKNGRFEIPTGRSCRMREAAWSVFDWTFRHSSSSPFAMRATKTLGVSWKAIYLAWKAWGRYEIPIARWPEFA